MLFGKPYDEGYSILRSLLAEAREAGVGRISAPQYRRALGVEPALRELLDPSSDRVLADYLGSLLASCISRGSGTHFVKDLQRARQPENRGT